MLAPGAHLLANARHHDASRASVGADSTLSGAFDADGPVKNSQERLREYIVTKQGPPLPRRDVNRLELQKARGWPAIIQEYDSSR